MESMKKQIQGIALILFGILLALASGSLNSLGIDVTVPWVLIGLIIGIVGLVIIFSKAKSNDK